MAGTDSVAQDQIKSYVTRILRMKAEAKDIARGIREIYAEAKGSGFDKTILGKLVNYIERREAGSADLAEAEALFDLYLAAYDGIGTRVATHTHEAKSQAVKTPAASEADGLSGDNARQQSEPLSVPSAAQEVG